jgi:large subunit ribosomal protein L23
MSYHLWKYCRGPGPGLYYLLNIFLIHFNYSFQEFLINIWTLFNVKVLKVNTVRYDGKKRTRRDASGLNVGYTSRWKKAIVQIDTDPSDVIEYLAEDGKTVTVTKKYKTEIEDFGFNN